MPQPSFLRRAAAALAGLAFATGAAQAAEFGNITINGYGHQSFLKTTDNTWLEPPRVSRRPVGLSQASTAVD
jgi:hypothetical protein